MNKDNRKRDAMINEILLDFDFERVHAIMVLMGVKWYGLKGDGERRTPSVDEIISVSREILTEAYDRHKADSEYNGCGKYQMFAEAFNDGQLELTYRPFCASSFENSYNEDGIIIDEPDPKADIKAKRIEDCDVSVRARNICIANDIYTLGDICKLHKTDWLKFRNSGKKTLIELDDLLHDNGLDWAEWR
jgi:hypothetical protein